MEQLSSAGITANLNYYNALIEKKKEEIEVLSEFLAEETKKMFTLNTN